MRKFIYFSGIILLFITLFPVSGSAQTLPACGQGQANGLSDNDIDHYDLVCFTSIPDSFVTSARNMRLLFVDRSVGANINEGLDCLGSGASYALAPSYCKSGLDTTTYISDTKYSRGNWDFAHYGDGGWQGNVSNYILNTGLRDINRNPITPVYSSYDAMSFQFSYLSVGSTSSINNNPGGFFVPYPGDTLRIQDIHDMETFEDTLPNATHIYATTSLARSIGTYISLIFNNTMRSYAAANGHPLLDFADIGSHNPQGILCYDNITGEYPALCPEYTTELNGGHLSEGIGRQRVAKAMWLVMTGIAGWRPNGTNFPSPTPLPSPTQNPTPSPSPSTTPSPTRCLPLGDIDCSGKINTLDFSYIVKYWGTTNYLANLNNNGLVDGIDAQILLNAYLQ